MMIVVICYKMQSIFMLQLLLLDKMTTEFIFRIPEAEVVSGMKNVDLKENYSKTSYSKPVTIQGINQTL